MTFLDCKVTARLIGSEYNQLVFLLLVHIPWIESSEVIGFIRKPSAKSVRACEVRKLWKSCLWKTCQVLQIYKSGKGQNQHFHWFVSWSFLNSSLLRSLTFERFLESEEYVQKMLSLLILSVAFHRNMNSDIVCTTSKLTKS